ncbi:DUF2515 domain-containing protein [Peribacillus cavernae]|uniref:DUF2515 domain-containing protein n=1 Tax=Peribacillus cavernae TaxID=1674310 RepID=A0A433HF49_9BACI|nr:DUF2515 family protein [Peribacillus cavernae]MDQ0221188.1 hypothetical protein [Peribacillus cavernae]RUQ26932.1 DUF2515 domain-containing protein [Peribacillus cavernae]
MKKQITNTPASHPLFNIEQELKKKSDKKNVNRTPAEIELIQTIETRTRQLNINNVTRTQAYLEYYCKHPEIEWALLGHMVSRNGGWNMTDLKGEFLSKLLTEKEQHQFFLFLERGNWLIFQDVYPQFLVYEESVKRKTSLFYLLPSFGVSTFMETIWNFFWMNSNRYILAIALIINEQSYLEQRVIQNKDYQKSVLKTIEFKLQDLLSLSHILFPYETSKSGEMKLLGQTLHQFASLHERINLGKRLYSLLFSNQRIVNEIGQWAVSNPHTGSRKDFWPHIFNDVKVSLPGSLYIPQIKNCTLKKKAPRLYSPKLKHAWKNVKQKQAESGDWFQDWRIIDYLENSDKHVDGEITHEYCKTIERLELAIFTKKALFLRKE